MSGEQVARAFMAVDRAHPRRIERSSDEWLRCAAILENAAHQVESIGARQSDIGGQTGPSMARAMTQACEVLRVKARDLRRGADALSYIAEATKAHQEERRRIDRDHPEDGAGTWTVAREEGSRKVADSQESALRHGIAVMKSIQVGDDPRRTPIYVSGPTPVRPPTLTWWPRDEWPEPPIDPTVDPDDDYDDQPAVPQGPLGSPSTPSAPAAPVGSPSAPGGSGLGSVALGGAAVLGGAGAIAGARGVAAAVNQAGSSRAIGAGGASGSGGVLGRSGAAGGGAAGGGAGGGGAGGRGSGAGGAGGAGGRGGRRTKEEREQGDRELFDDGEGWLDDDGGPGVLR